MYTTCLYNMSLPVLVRVHVPPRKEGVTACGCRSQKAEFTLCTCMCMRCGASVYACTRILAHDVCRGKGAISDIVVCLAEGGRVG
jgi:hypothetical protein